MSGDVFHDFNMKIKRILDTSHLSHAYIIESNISKLAQEAGEYFANEIIKIGGGVKAENILIVQGEGKTGSIKVENIDLLRQRLMKKPFNGEYMVALIKEAEKMNPQSQNKLLKILEEPTGGVVIILTSNLTEALLPTIRSRCNFLKLSEHGTESSPSAYGDSIIENMELEPAEVEVVYEFVGKVLKKEPYYKIKATIDNIAGKERQKDQVIESLDLCECVIREIMAVKLEIENIDRIKKYGVENIAPYASTELLTEIIMKIESTKNKIKRDMNRTNALKMMVLDIIDLEEKN